MSEHITTVYALLDPRDSRVRYVGKSVNPERRFREHTRLNLKPGDPRAAYPINRWIKKLKEDGVLPVMETLERCAEDWAEVERRWIAHYRAQGSLLNVTDGGEGVTGIVFSEERRRKMSEARKGRPGRPNSPETRAKLSAANKGKKKPPLTAEQRAQKVAILSAIPRRPKGYKLPPDQAARRTATLRCPHVHQAASDAKCKSFIVTHPDGREELVQGLARFCKSLGLDAGSMNKVAYGKQGRTQYKGYRVRPL